MKRKRKALISTLILISLGLSLFSCTQKESSTSLSISTSSTSYSTSQIIQEGETYNFAKRISDVSTLSYQDILSYSNLTGNENITYKNLLHMLYIAFPSLDEPNTGFYDLIKTDRSKYTFNFTNLSDELKNEYYYFYDRSILGGNEGFTTYERSTKTYTFNVDEKPTLEILDLVLRRISAYEGSNLEDDFYSYVNKEIIKTSKDYSGVVDLENLKNKIKNINSSLSSSDENKTKIDNFNETLKDDESKKDNSKGLRNYLKRIYECTDFSSLNTILKELFELNRFDPFINSISIDTIDIEANLLDLKFAIYNIFYNEYDLESKSYLKSNQYQALKSYLPSINVEETTIQSMLEEYIKVHNVIAVACEEEDEEDIKTVSFTPSTILNNFNIGNEYTTIGLNFNYTYINDLNIYNLMNEEFSKSLDATKVLVMYKLMSDYSYALDEETRIKYKPKNTDEYILNNGYKTIYVPYIANELISSYSKTEEYNAIYDKVNDCLDNIKEGAKERFENNTWLSSIDKTKMLEKLEALNYNIMIGRNGENNKYQTHNYLGLKDNQTLFENLSLYNKEQFDSKIKYIGTKDNDALFFYSDPFTTNAYNSFGFNNVLILPGYILQIKNINTISTEELYARIGTTIGHEFMHSFDSSGFKYDKDKNYNTNWVSKESQETFLNKTNKVKNFYSNYEEFPLYKMDGNIKLNEAVADIEGFESTINATKKVPNFDYDKFFKEYAKMNAYVIDIYSYILLVADDSHPIAQGRCNPVLMNNSKFQEFYNIKEGDLMYLSKEDSISVF